MRDNHFLWKHAQKGIHHFYSYQKVLAATSGGYILDLPEFMRLHHIRLVFDDTTSKDYDVQVQDDPSNALYCSVKKAASDTNTSILILPSELNLQLETSSRISIVLANATIGKVIRIIIQLDEL